MVDALSALMAMPRMAPLLHTGMSAWIGLIVFGPVIALVAFFVWSYKRGLDKKAREDDRSADRHDQLR